MAAPALAPGKPLIGSDLSSWLIEVEQRLSSLEAPQGPRPLFTTTKAALPAAKSYFNCAAFLTDLGVVAVSNGTRWLNAGTGAVIG